MKKLIKYQFSDIKYVLLFFYLILIALMSVGTINFSSIAGDEVYVTNGSGFSDTILCFVIGLCFFKEHFCFSLQNGYTRKVFFKSSLILLFIISLIVAAANLVINAFFEIFTAGRPNYNVENIVQTFYPEFLSQHNGFVNVFTNLFFYTALMLMCLCAGFLIAILFYRANKMVKVIIAAGLPVFAFIGLPVFVQFFPNLSAKVMQIILITMGANSGNPFIAVLTFFITSVILSAISYLFVRKSEI